VRSVVTMRSVIAVAVALSCAGCGSAVDGGRSNPPPSKGPLGADAAVDALECDGKRPFFRATGDYDAGLATVQSSAEDAFDNYVDESGFGYRAPVKGYRVERKDGGGALLSYDVGDRTKVAVVVADGIRDWDDDVGWGVVGWAQCDPSEFPAEVTDDLGIGVWEDASGRRLPVTRVRSFQGPEHCDWTDITFLLIGPDEHRADWYVRDVNGEFSDLLNGTFADDATLPNDATSTGWRRSGRQLWLGHDKEAAYLVDRDDPHTAERWPAAKEPILCA
jgi:hypothetical protein